MRGILQSVRFVAVRALLHDGADLRQHQLRIFLGFCVSGDGIEIAVNLECETVKFDGRLVWKHQLNVIQVNAAHLARGSACRLHVVAR